MSIEDPEDREPRYESGHLAQLELGENRGCPVLIDDISSSGARLSMQSGKADELVSILERGEGVRLRTVDQSISIKRHVYTKPSSRLNDAQGSSVAVAFPPVRGEEDLDKRRRLVEGVRSNPSEERSDPRGRVRLNRIIERGALEGAEAYGTRLVEKFDCSLPLKSALLRLAVLDNCVRVVVQTVPDRLRARAESFVRRVQSVAPWTERLHFFARGSSPDRYTYLGCIEIRTTGMRSPAGGAMLGQVTRAVFGLPGAPPDEDSGFLSNRLDEDVSGDFEGLGLVARSAFYVMARPTTTTFLGESMRMRAIPYEQQSVVDGTCGHAALASASRVLASVFRSWPLSQTEVTGLAGVGVGVDLPESGAARVIEFLRYKVECYFKEFCSAFVADIPNRRPVGPRRLLDIIHCAIDSQLPPYIVFNHAESAERHAVVGIGHVSSIITGERLAEAVGKAREEEGHPLPGMNAMRQRSMRPMTSTEWLRGFLVHDSSSGPYLELAIDRLPPSARPASIKSQIRGRIEGVSAQSDIETVLVPLPPGVDLSISQAYDGAEVRLMKMLASPFVQRVTDRAGAGQLPAYQALVEKHNAPSGSELVMTLHLDHSNRLRAMLVTEFAERKIECPELRSIELPRYVYMVSIMSVDDMVGAASCDARLQGFMLLDSTASAYSSDLLTYCHLGDYVEYLHPQTGERREHYTMPFPEDMSQRQAWARSHPQAND